MTNTRDAFGFFNRVELPIDEIWEDITFPDEAIKQTIVDSDLREYYDEDEVEYQAQHELLESLHYWLIYFQPDIEDVDVALEVGLVPFHYNDEFYLALGGCGMDLSPKLDAYQALTSKAIDPSSKLLQGPANVKYFQYVVGREVTAKVMLAVEFDG